MGFKNVGIDRIYDVPLSRVSGKLLRNDLKVAAPGEQDSRRH